MAIDHRRRQRLVAGSQVLLGLLLLFGIWVALPARHLPVDALGTVAAAALLCAGMGLMLRRSWAPKVARLLAWFALGLGCLTVTALCWSAATLAGLYGPVGSGGALLMSVVALLILPYLVALPALQLTWLAPRAGEEGAPGDGD